jgi:hypothetical protein
MAEEKIDSYVDREGVADDTRFFLESIQKIIDQFDKLASIKVNINGANSMREIVDGANEAKTAFDGLTAAKDKMLKSDLLAAKVAKESASARSAEAKASQAAAKSSQDKAKADAMEAKAIKELAAAEKLEAQAKKELALQDKALAQARKENAAAALKEQQAASSSQREKEKQQVNELGAAYKQYSQAARDASLRAKSYALTLGENDARTLAAVKNANEMNETLKRVDASVGQFGRQVGDYKKGFDGLGMSFTQISRELPSLAVSFQTFALAVSNNLPMVVDEVKKVSTEVKELRAQGEQTPSVFKRVLSSALSLNVGISIAIALFTAFAGKIADAVTGLFSAESAAKKAAKQQQEYNERIEEAIELNEKYDSTIARSSGTVNRGLENQLAYARAAGKSEKEILKIEQDLLEERQLLAQANFDGTGGETRLGELGKELSVAQQNLNEFLVKERRAYDIFGNVTTELTDKEKEQGEFLKKEFALREKAFLRQKEVVEEYYNANRDAIVKDLEIKKLESEQVARFFAAELQYRADLLKAISQIEDGQLTSRLNARREAYEKEKIILTGQYLDQRRDAKDNQVKIAEIENEFAFNKVKLQEEYEKDVLNIRATSLIKQRELLEQDNALFVEYQNERLDKQIAALQNVQEKRQEEAARGLEIEISALNKAYQLRIKTTKEGSKEREKIDRDYAEKRAEIEYSYAVAELKNQIFFAEELIKVRKAAGENVTKEEEELHRLRMQLSDLETKHIIDNNKKQGRSHKEKLEKLEKDLEIVKTAYNETAKLVTGLLSAGVDRQKNAVQEQIDEIDRKKEKEIEAVEQTTASEQEKADKIAIINARAEAQKNVLEQKQRQLDLQRAKFEKAATIGRIVIETALAVVHQLGSGDPYTAIGRAIAVGAIGAAQLAVAIATPLPRFKDGRDKGPATFAVVGDGGVNEVVASPDLKQAYVTPATDTLTYLKKDWKVFPDIAAFSEAASSMGSPTIKELPMLEAVGNDVLIGAVVRSNNRIEQAIKNKKETHFHWDNGQLKKAIKDGENWIRYRNTSI